MIATLALLQLDPFLVREVLRIVVTGVVFLAIGTPLAVAFGRRIARGDGSKDADPRALQAVDARLARIEQAVEAIAVEVERVAEGQRYATKLQAEQAKRAALPDGHG
jgi:hypothetical protein